MRRAARGSSGSKGSTAAPSSQRPWGSQRSDETPLTGDTASKVRALALAKVPGGTIVRVETDADGNAAYEAHMTKADGTPVTVYVSKALDVVSVQSGMPGPPRAAERPGGAAQRLGRIARTTVAGGGRPSRGITRRGARRAR